MTTTFPKREQQFENLYAHDTELQFKVFARRNFLFGLWAAKQMNMEEVAADEYARSLVEIDMGVESPEQLLIKVQQDLQMQGIQQTVDDLRYECEQCYAPAQEEIFSEA